jgi:hypothetical protein
MAIHNYNDFIKALSEAGFSQFGGKGDGVVSLIHYGWGCEPTDDSIHWHTGDPETDPWEWRMRVLNECNDVAYAKMFFRKAGYITKEWYPYFLAARRGTNIFEEAYADGTMNQISKRIFEIIEDNGNISFHEIKQRGRFSKEDNSRFERAIVELQMKMFITMCGSQQKISKSGEEHGWASTMFCTTEHFWGDEVFGKAVNITEKDAIEKITAQIYKLNPNANEKKIIKFIKG